MPVQRDGFLLDQIASGYAPVVSGRSALPMTGLEGIPGMDRGDLLGVGMQFLLGPKLQAMMGRYGYTPMGVGHDINVYDVMRHRQFAAAQQEAMAAAAGVDAETHMKTFRGLAAVTGTPWGAEQRRAARQITDMTRSISPVLAEMFPDLLDQLGGEAGSATVMANRLMQSGRYRIDPVTGRMGATGETVARQTQQLFDQLYRQENLAEMKGISAGQVGSLVDELTRRGMIDSDTTPLRQQTLKAIEDLAYRTPEQLQKAAADQGVALPADLKDLGIEELDKLRLDPAVADRLRAFDADRIKRSISSYVDAVGAVRDIFGDSGRPDAPMAELISSLEALSQGGVSQLDTGKLNMIVRTTGELAKQAGMTIDQATAIQQHAASRAEQLGISPLAAIPAAQDSLAWGTAFRAMGGSATPAWNRMDASGMQQLDANLRVQAAASEQAQRMAVVERISTNIGGFEQGSTAEALFEAVKNFQTTFVDPQTGDVRSIRMSAGQYRDMLVGARSRDGSDPGITEGLIDTMLSQKSINMERIVSSESGIVDTTRQLQTLDVREWEAGRYGEVLSQRLKDRGMDDAKAREVADLAGLNIAKRVGQLSHSQFADRRTRTELMASIIEDELKKAGADKFIARESLDDSFFRLSADDAYGYIDRAVAEGQLGDLKSYQNVHATTQQATQERGKQNKTQAVFQAQIANEMAGLRRGSILRRAVQYLQDSGASPEDASWQDMLSTALGGERFEDVGTSLSASMESIVEARAELESLQTKYSAATSSEERDEIVKQFNSQIKLLGSEIRNLKQNAEQHGIFIDQTASLSPQDTQAALQAIDQLQINQQDLAGLSGGFSSRVTKEEIEEIKQRPLPSYDVAKYIKYSRELQKVEDNLSDKEVGEFYWQNLDQFDKREHARAAMLSQRQEKIHAQYEASLDPTVELVADNPFRETAVSSFMKTAKLETDEEARDVILLLRQATPLAPDEAMVQSFVENGYSREDAAKAADAALRKQRFGITDKEVDEAMQQLPADRQTLSEAVQAVVDARTADKLKVTQADLDQYVLENPEISGADPEVISREIRKARQQESKERWQQLWYSEDGQAFKEQTQAMLSRADDIAANLILSKPLIRKMGPQGVEYYKQIRSAQSRLSELAARYADGSETRLLAKDLTNITDPTIEQKVRKNIDQIQTELRDSLHHVLELQTKKGRNWGEDTETTARQLLRLPTDKNATLTSEQKTKLAEMQLGLSSAAQLTDKDAELLDALELQEKQLQLHAERFGVPKETLREFAISGEVPAGSKDIYTGVSDNERQILNTVAETQRRAESEILEAKSRLAAVPPEDKQQATSIQQLIKDKQNEIVQSKSKLSPLAKRRGMSSDELLQRYRTDSLMTAENLQAVRDNVQRQQAVSEQLKPRIGPEKDFESVEDMKQAADALKAFDRYAEDYRDIETQSSQDLLKSVFEVSGLAPDQHKAEIDKLSREFSTREGFHFARKLVGKSAYLSDLARKRLQGASSELSAEQKQRLGDAEAIGAGELIKQYREVKDDDKLLMRFRESMGMGKDDSQFQEFEKSVELFDLMGMTKLSQLKAEDRLKETMHITRSLDQGLSPYATKSELTDSDKYELRRMEISGTLKITGDQADISAQNGRI